MHGWEVICMGNVCMDGRSRVFHKNASVALMHGNDTMAKTKATRVRKGGGH